MTVIAVVITLKLDTSDLSKAQSQMAPVSSALKVVQDQLKQVETVSGQATAKASAGLQQMAQAAIAVAGAFSAGKIFGSFIQESALLAARVEVVNTVLGQVAKNAGISGAAAREYRDQVKALGITTQEAGSATTRFIQNQLDLTKVTDLARVAQNAAVVANQNSSEALQGLIHGITTLQPEVLRTYGIIINLEQAYKRFSLQNQTSTEALTAQQKQQIALNEVLRVGAGLAGTYTAAFADVGKQITSLARVIEDAQDAFGKGFLPVLRATVPVFSDLLQTFTQLHPLTQSAISSIIGVTIAIGGLSLAVGALQAAFSSLGIAAFFTNPIGIAVLALGGLAAAILTVKAARDRELESHRQAVKDLTGAQQAVRLLTTDSTGLVNALDSLVSKTTRTAEENRTLADVLHILMQRYPGLREQIDPTTKSLDEQAKAVQRVTSAITEMEAKANSLAPGILRNLLPKPEQFLRPGPGALIPGQPGLTTPTPEQIAGSFEKLEPGMAAIQKAAEGASKSFAELLIQVKQLGIMLPTDVVPRLQAVSKLLERIGTEPTIAMAQLGTKTPQELQTLKTVLLQEQADLQNKLQNQTSARIQNETAAAITGAKTQLDVIEARFQKEAALLSTAQQKREQALQDDTQSALNAENLTAKQREDILRASAIRQLDLTRQSALERIDLEKQRLAETSRASDSVITAEIARQEQMKRLGPEAAANANVQIKELLGQRTADHAKTSAEITKLDADAAKAAADFEVGITKVKSDEGQKQIQQTKQRLDAEAALRQTTLQGELAILDAKLALNQANVQDQLGLVKSSMLSQIDIKQKGFQEEASIQARQFEIRKQLIQNQANEEIRLAEKQSRSTIGIQEKANLELEALGIRQQAVQQNLRNQEVEEWRRFVERVQDVVGNFLYDLFSGQINGIKDLLDRLKEYFFRTLADMIAEAVANPIAIVVKTVIGGLTGALAGTLAPALGLGPALLGGAGETGQGGPDILGLAGIGLQLRQFFAPTGFLGRGFTFLTDSLNNAASSIQSFFGFGGLSPADTSALLAGEEGIGGMASGAGLGPAPVSGLTALGGLAGIGAGIYSAINAKGIGGMAGGAIGAAGGAAALAAGLGIGLAPIFGPIGLALAALAPLLGNLIDSIGAPAGPRFTLGNLGGLGIGGGAGGLEVTGALTSRIGREERLPSGVDTSAIQDSLTRGVTNLVKGMVEALNKVALRPEELLEPTQKALDDALKNALTINTSSAKNFQKDVEEQTRFIGVQVSSFFLKPLNEAFRQLESSELDEQITRLPDTTAGMVQVFKSMNTQLDELSKVANTDVLRQLSSVRNRVEDFGASLADTARVISESIVTQITDQLVAQANTLFDKPLAKQITEFGDLLTDSLQALAALRSTEQSLQSVGLDAGGVTGQIEILTKTMVDTAADVSTQIVTGALTELSGDLSQVTAQAVSVQATTVNSLFNDSIQALNVLWNTWHQLEAVGLDASVVQEQFTKLVSGVLETTTKVLDDAFKKGSFSEFLNVLAGIPKAVTDLNPSFAKLQQIGAAFQQVVGPIAQAIAELEDTLRTPAERIAFTSTRIADLQQAIADAGDSVDQALPLYAQLAQAILDNANLQIQAIQEIAQAWHQAMDQVTQDIATLEQAVLPLGAQINQATTAFAQSIAAYDAAIAAGDTVGAIEALQDFEQGILTIGQLQIEQIQAVQQAWTAAMDQISQSITGLEATVLSLDQQLALASQDVANSLADLSSALAAGNTVKAINAVQDYAAGIQAVGALQIQQIEANREATIDAQQAVIDGTQDSIDAIQDQMKATQKWIDAAQKAIQAQQEQVSLLEQEVQAREATVSTLKQQIESLKQLSERTGSLVRGTAPPPAALASIRANLAETQGRLAGVTGDEAIKELEKLVSLNEELKQLGEQTNRLDLVKEAMDNLIALQTELNTRLADAGAQLTVAEQQLQASQANLDAANAQLTIMQADLEALHAMLEGQQEAVNQLQDVLDVQRKELDAIQRSTYWDEQIAAVNAGMLTQLYQVKEWLRAIQGATSWDEQIFQINLNMLAQLYNVANLLNAIQGGTTWEDQIKAIQLETLATMQQMDRDLQALFLKAVAQAEAAGLSVAVQKEMAFWLSTLSGYNLKLPVPIEVKNFYEAPKQHGGFVGYASGRYYAQGGMVPVIGEPLERVFTPPLSHAQAGALQAMNTAFPRFGGGGFTVPGSGTGDTVRMMVPSGSFILNRTASSAMGYQQGGPVQGGSSQANGGKTEVHNNYYSFPNLTVRSQRDFEEFKAMLLEVERWRLKRRS